MNKKSVTKSADFTDKKFQIGIYKKVHIEATTGGLSTMRRRRIIEEKPWLIFKSFSFEHIFQILQRGSAIYRSIYESL